MAGLDRRFTLHPEDNPSIATHFLDVVVSVKTHVVTKVVSALQPLAHELTGSGGDDEGIGEGVTASERSEARALEGAPAHPFPHGPMLRSSSQQ